ncbi:LCP family protein [Amycolatopsis keratiniphila]|uniref:LytTR family transcriptional regulator n=2 Tax=Amycolatopsis keratiniphila TaxID=129921 RepID=A0A1W2LTE9_9PSEU|nr:LytTR family transcriptional regulator [Amycolatopsis keratiniphila subsp. nogabecina]ONF67923.1 LytTR family transcriptional regulator [Amycolatopsis keratiniphila subsp. keratiniphila]SDU68182.1 cell envelope-related function transcriptional attenuator common domain-containing protein [Amycolatopsis keratiniphila]
MEYPPRNGYGDRRPARPRQDAPGRVPSRPAPPRSARQAAGPPPRRPAPKRAPRRSFRGPKIALGLVSLLVMGLTGYAWAAMDGLTFANVGIGADEGEKPADGARDILLVGLDSRTDAQGNPLSKEVLAQLRAGQADGELNTDSLIFVHIPNDGSKAVAISLPRDSYVDIPGGFGKHKINSAYARAMLDERKKLQEDGVSDPKELDQKANEAGAKTLIKTVEQLTGSTIDNYAAINLLGFSEITQAIGGVDVCLNDDVDDQFSGAKFTKGPHTISGVEALGFVRQRHGLPRGDLDRVVRQQVFMAGMARKVLSAGTLANPGKLNDLITAIKKSVVLNQNWDVFGFAQQMKSLTGGQLEFRTIPIVNIEYKTPNDGVAIQVDPKQVKSFVQGLAGPQPGEQQQAPPAESANKATTVDVRNSTNRDGLASSVLKQLVDKGFTAGDTATASARKKTVVWVAKGEKAAGQAVADALGGNPTVQEDKSVEAGHVTVFLGSDFKAPSGAEGSGSSQNAAGSSAAAPPPEQSDEKPITAEGVPCVN